MLKENVDGFVDLDLAGEGANGGSMYVWSSLIAEYKSTGIGRSVTRQPAHSSHSG